MATINDIWGRGARRSGHYIDQTGEVAGRVGRAFEGRLNVDLHLDLSEVEGLADILRQAIATAPQAVAFALTRTAQEVRTPVARALRDQTGLPYGIVRRALQVVPADRTTLAAAIVARGSFVPLKDYKARQTKRGVSAAPWNRRRVFPHTFIIRRYGGNVYVRVDRGRFPLHKLYGPAIPVDMMRDETKRTFETMAPRVLLKRLDHELGRLLAK